MTESPPRRLLRTLRCSRQAFPLGPEPCFVGLSTHVALNLAMKGPARGPSMRGSLAGTIREGIRSRTKVLEEPFTIEDL